ncbi:hypothetical protein EVAR_16453_1 [Eumeta japonica]|uniref:Uncharacterized protein n=1 Tax=Eumeta variegata TaxID=151549 RepID=A0A4C1UK85_EUMVA|nr:hypothetical protein EVAR_16453_1 [Eumeta japonica]
MAGGPTGPSKNLSDKGNGIKVINLEKLKSLFFTFEADSIINKVITNDSGNSRELSPCSSVSSGKRSSSPLSSKSDSSYQSDATVTGSDEDEDKPFQVVRRKTKRVTRR